MFTGSAREFFTPNVRNNTECPKLGVTNSLSDPVYYKFSLPYDRNKKCMSHYTTIQTTPISLTTITRSSGPVEPKDDFLMFWQSSKRLETILNIHSLLSE